MDPRVGQSLDGPSSVSDPNFVSVTPSMNILFPILRRNEVSTLWSSFFLLFLNTCVLFFIYFILHPFVGEVGTHMTQHACGN